MFRPRVLLAAVATLMAVSLSSCAAAPDDEPNAAAGSPTTTTTSAPSHDATLDAYYHQRLDWSMCEDNRNFECGTLEVPLDYEHPDDASIEVKLTRARDTADRMPVVFNPGGPGSSGVSFVQNQLDSILSDHLAQHISAIGFDPRGVGASEPVRCVTAEEFDASRELVMDASTPDGWSAAQEATAELGQQCLERSGEIVEHVDTISAAKDMDILRSALGEPSLHYFGLSYGTKLGATYAELFPETVGNFVLDSVLPPSAESFEVTKAQAVGFEQSLDAWANWCAMNPECRVGSPGDPESVLSAVTAFFDTVTNDPLQYPDGRVQPIQDLLFGVIAALYSQDSWGMLAQAFEQGIARDFGSHPPLFLAFADAYYGRQPNGEYTNATDAFQAINCLDYTAAERTFADARQQAAELSEAAPIFGELLSYSTGCNGWPVAPVDPLGPTDAQGSSPIIVTSLTSDPATPLHFSHELAEQLDNSIHITVEGEGHGGYAADNSCIVEAIDGYFLDGTYPPDGLVCS